jgi:hypothetical protein
VAAEGRALQGQFKRRLVQKCPIAGPGPAHCTRKHPRQKVRNDQEVPLLGKTFDIVNRQPKPDDVTEESKIFPVKTDTIATIFRVRKQRLASSTYTSMIFAMKGYRGSSRKATGLSKWL